MEPWHSGASGFKDPWRGALGTPKMGNSKGFAYGFLVWVLKRALNYMGCYFEGDVFWVLEWVYR